MIRTSGVQNMFYRFVALGVSLSLYLLIASPSLEAQEAHSHHADQAQAMSGLYGPYSATREGSGTAWQPDASPMHGAHLSVGPWSAMAHGSASFVFDVQDGNRGDHDAFSANMLMGTAQRPLGPGTFGLRGMLSLEPLTMGEEGYALLLQTGETADGETPLTDRQHPHDLFMELATTYSVPLGDQSSAFAYFGLPGEPALGPVAFMHRASAGESPQAPIAHHWLDSTHITFGVATLGYVWDRLKIEASAFRGREPDERRWDIEEPRFDSYAGRLSFNPTERWALQISSGSIDSPEQLHPEVDTQRLTASAAYSRPWRHGQWHTLVAWGQNRNDPGRILDAFLIESALQIRERHTLSMRAENVENDELFAEDNPEHGKVFTVNKLSFGYLYDLPTHSRVRWGIGAVASINVLPRGLEEAYNNTPLGVMLYTRIRY